MGRSQDDCWNYVTEIEAILKETPNAGRRSIAKTLKSTDAITISECTLDRWLKQHRDALFAGTLERPMLDDDGKPEEYADDIAFVIKAGPHADYQCQVAGGREDSSMSDVVIEEDEGLASESSIRVDHSRGKGEFRGGQGDDSSGDPPVEETFVDFLVSPDEGHPREDGCQVAQVKGQALIDIPETSAGKPELGQGLWN